MSIYLRNILRFILLILIQSMLLNYIPLKWSSGSMMPTYVPFIYMLFIALLPISIKTPYLLVLSFLTGLTMDAFLDTGGIHAIACLFLAVSRKTILNIVLPKPLEEYKNSSPNIKEMKLVPFLSYLFLLFLIHLTVYYLIEIWSFRALGYAFIKIILSLATSMVFALIYAFLFSESIATKYYEV